MNCGPFSDKRFKCHSVYGKRGEDCLHEELSEKRCLSLQHCFKEAKEYYGNSVKMDLSVLDEDGQAPSYLSNKGLCASWAEAFAYEDKGFEYGERVASHHREARNVVMKDNALKRQCRDIAFELAQCLRNKRVFRTIMDENAKCSYRFLNKLKRQFPDFFTKKQTILLQIALPPSQPGVYMLP